MNVMLNILVAVQMLSAIAMVGLILIQHGKGADMGAACGSGSAGSLFGASGSANFLSRTTAALAVVFFVCTLLLAYLLLAGTGSWIFWTRTQQEPRPSWLRLLHFWIGGVLVALVLLLLAIGIVGTLGHYGSLGHSWHLLAGLPIVAIVMLVTGITYSGRDVVLAIPAVLIAGALHFLFVYTLALSALWGQQAGGVTEFATVMVFLLGGVAAPVMLLPESVRPWGEALPFRAMAGFPAEIASGTLSANQLVVGYGYQFLWLAVFVPLASVVWRAGLRRYAAVGG